MHGSSRAAVAVLVLLVGHVAQVAAFRYLATQAVRDFKLAMLVAVLGTGIPAALLHDPRCPEGGRVEAKMTLLGVVRIFAAIYSYARASMGQVVVGIAGSVVLVALIEHYRYGRKLTGRHQAAVGSIVAAMLVSATSMLVAQSADAFG